MSGDIADPWSKLNCGWLRIGPDQVIEEASESVAQWCGRPLDQFIGQPLGDVLAPGSMVYWMVTVEPLLEQQGHAWDLALELRTATERAAVLVNARRMEGRTECLLFPFSGRRRFERKMLEAEIRALSQAGEIRRLAALEQFRRDFINAAAHELATPMTPLQIQFHLLKKALAGNEDPKVQRAAQSVERNIDKLARFASSLVASADVDAGHIGLDIQPIALAATVRDGVDGWRSQAPHRRIEVTGAEVTVEADQKTVTDCLVHLLENAVKFSAEDSVVRVIVEAGPPARVIIEDEGRGIDPARIPELGRPFVQVHDRSEFTQLGAGLGLHIVAGLMAAQGGRLVVESDGIGQGTRAILEFQSIADTVKAKRVEAESAPTSGR